MGQARGPKSAEKKPTNPLFEKTPRNFGIGGHIQPKRDLSRYVKWPAYVRLQRQRKVLYQRLKVPPSINQFSQTLDKSTGASSHLAHFRKKHILDSGVISGIVPVGFSYVRMCAYAVLVCVRMFRGRAMVVSVSRLGGPCVMPHLDGCPFLLDMR